MIPAAGPRRLSIAALALMALLPWVSIAAPQSPAVPAGGSPAMDSLAADSLALGSGVGVTPAPPPAPRDYIAEVRAAFTRENRAYSGTRIVLAFVTPLYDILIAMLILFSGLASVMRDIAHNLGKRLYVRVLVFLVLYIVAEFVLAFPLTCYRGYALEHQYGLSTQSFAAWMADLGKDAAVTVAVFGLFPILWLGYCAIRRWPRGWWLPVAAGTLPLIVAGTLLQPLVVDPLYNKFTPLRDQQLKEKILELAARAGIPGRHVFEVDKSAQTVTYNAYVSGFGPSQRIVLWDTTIKGMKQDEILFVMGHEMGHYKLHHIWKGIAMTSAFSFLFFYFMARIAGWGMKRFGAHWGFQSLADVASLPLLAATMTLLAMLAQPAVNGFSRRIEHEADVFAVEVTRDNDAGARSFLKLSSQNRSNPEPPLLIKWFLYSHPPLLERIRFALQYQPWRHGLTNRYYQGLPAGQ
jgi:STE24 endopeptidase